jgi:predicted DNA-binding transcriptional regulator AlpA
MQHLPKTGFFRLSDIIGSKTKAPLIPISRANWYKKVKAGKFPSPTRITERCSGYPVEVIYALIEQLKIPLQNNKNN